MSLTASITPEVIALLQASSEPLTPSTLLQRMVLMGMVTPQQQQDIVAGLGEVMEFSAKYFEYRRNRDLTVFVCDNHDQYQRMLEGEARLGSTWFSRRAADLIAEYSNPFAARTPGAQYIAEIAAMRLRQDPDAIVEGFFKRPE